MSKKPKLRQAVRDARVLGNRWVVYSCLSRLKKRGILRETLPDDWGDLISAGNLALVEAAGRYQRGRAKFSSFAFTAVQFAIMRESILQEARRHGWECNLAALDLVLDEAPEDFERWLRGFGLSEKEFQVINYLYGYDISHAQAAKQMSIAKSTLNEIRKKAMFKIYKSMKG